MIDAEYLGWLKSSAPYQVILVEASVQVDGVESVVYMATKPYTTGPTDTPANTTYLPIASIDQIFTEQLALDGEGGLSTGELQIENVGGSRDAWVGPRYVWKNRSVKAYVADMRWPRADARLIFNGISADIAPSGRDAFALKLRDKLQQLNTTVSETKLGGTSELRDSLLPITLGQVFNVTPLLVNAAILKYQVHAGPIHSIIEVRDNGAPVQFTADPATGTFILAAAPVGTVTVSLRGSATGGYVDTAAQLVRRLVTTYGKVSDRFTDDDLDLASFAAFDAACPQSMGMYLSERQNVLEACRQLLNSLGAQMVMSRLGKLRIIRLALPGYGTPTIIGPEHIMEKSNQSTLTPGLRTDPVGAVKIAFVKNWTVQEASTLANLPESHKRLLDEEWLTTTKTDAATLATYRLNSEPVQVDTMLLTRADADAEAQRRLDLWKVPRTSYEFEGVPELLGLELGQAITVYSPRFDMSAGTTGTVTSLAFDWKTGRIAVGFVA